MNTLKLAIFISKEQVIIIMHAWDIINVAIYNMHELFTVMPVAMFILVIIICVATVAECEYITLGYHFINSWGCTTMSHVDYIALKAYYIHGWIVAQDCRQHACMFNNNYGLDMI